MKPEKHSPGPWRWSKGVTGREFVGSHLEAADGEEIFSVDHGTPVANPADARLIAAAPAMLAMLTELEWAGDSSTSICPVCGQRPPRRVNVPGEVIPGMPGMVRYTGETKEIPGGHAPDCRLAALLADLRKP